MLLSIAVIIACAAVLLMWGWYFPNPSPLIRPLLPPKQRWPEAQIRGWLRTGRTASAFLRFFERDPERVVPTGDGVLAPADGLITSAEVRDGIRYLVIALSFWDVHVQRCPMDGEVVSIENLGAEYMDGEGRDFAFLREKLGPVQKRVVFKTPQGFIAVRLITSLAARRLQVWTSSGTVVSRGQRLGRILLGSTVVLEVPESWTIMASPGQRVWAAETLLAEVVPAVET